MKIFTQKYKRSINKYLSSILFGESKSRSVENKVFILASLITLLAGIAGLFWNIFLGLPNILNIIIGIAIIAFSLMFYYSRYKNRYSPLLYICFSLIFLPILYFMNGGLNGSIPPIYIVFVAVAISLSNSKYHRLILMVTVINLLMLILAETFFFKEFIIYYTNTEAKEMDLSFGYIACLFFCYLLIRYYKNSITSKNTELHKINANKDLLFNIIAHDLRSPFNSILGLTEIMSNKSSDLTLDKIQEFAELTNKSSVKAFELLESLLEWGKIQQDKIQVIPQLINLKRFAIESVDHFKEEYTYKNIEISIQVPDDIEVSTDLHILQTVHRNLINNAIKFTPEGGEICISTESDDDDRVVMIIQDSGIGMSKEMVDNLFNLEINTNRHGTNGESSTGLGLIICKELLEIQGGVLKVESVLNKGCKFMFKIPEK